MAKATNLDERFGQTIDLASGERTEMSVRSLMCFLRADTSSSPAACAPGRRTFHVVVERSNPMALWMGTGPYRSWHFFNEKLGVVAEKGAVS